MAYNRASVHLLTFKRALVEGARVLSEALQWVSLVDYAVMAWGYVKVREGPLFYQGHLFSIFFMFFNRYCFFCRPQILLCQTVLRIRIPDPVLF
jgi:hypothetical protein